MPNRISVMDASGTISLEVTGGAGNNDYWAKSPFHKTFFRLTNFNHVYFLYFSMCVQQVLELMYNFVPEKFAL